jgi:putative glycosyltransferase (TIGR04348 family)
MHIAVVTPSAAGDRLGNSITAVRWAEILRALGHQVRVSTAWAGEDCDLLVALHARRSNPSIEGFRQAFPGHPIVLALTGTDLYCDLPSDAAARRSLGTATRIVGLQNLAGDELDDEARRKLRVIWQSALPPVDSPKPLDDCFEVCVLSHLRDVKDPLRAAWAVRDLPSASKLRIVHAGRALESVWAEKARTEEQTNPRYHWLGEQPHEATLALLARSRLLVLSSEVEGGANVISEAVVCGVPVLCSRIPGNIGMLGPDYPGHFVLKDTDALRSLLIRSETDKTFFQQLRTFVDRLKHRFSPEREKAAWQSLLEELLF